MSSRLGFGSPNGIGMFGAWREHGFSPSLRGQFGLALPQELTEINGSSDRIGLDEARARLRELKQPETEIERADPD